MLFPFGKNILIFKIVSVYKLFFVCLLFSFSLIFLTNNTDIIYYWLAFLTLAGLSLAIFHKWQIFTLIAIFVSASLLSINIFSVTELNNISNFIGLDTHIEGKSLSIPFCGEKYCDIEIGQIQILDNQSIWHQINGRLLLRIKVAKYHNDINLYDKVYIDSKIYQITNFADDFDYRGYLRSRQIYAVIYQDNYSRFDNPNIFEKILSVPSQLILNYNQLDYKQTNLINSILFGYKSDFGVELQSKIRDLGLSHMFAVSGYNLTIFFSWLIGLSIYIGRKNAYILSLVVMTIIMFVVGWQNLSALRAYIMGVFLIGGLMIGKKTSMLNSIGLALFIILLINPISYESVSFQLSFLAYVGLVVFASDISKKLSNIMPNFINSNFSSSLAATIFTLPIIISIYQNISVFSAISNVLVLPMIPLIMITGFVYHFLKVVPIISELITFILSGLLNILEVTVTILHQFLGYYVIYVPKEISYIFWIIIIFIIIWKIWNYYKSLNNYQNENYASQNTKNQV